ncbi:MAG: hypothetical protein NT028_09975 [candidate division Zixibacteria bacterium]|nr:hypothetical protein [candidate division Zixibacteria bacterium]
MILAPCLKGDFLTFEPQTFPAQIIKPTLDELKVHASLNRVEKVLCSLLYVSKFVTYTGGAWLLTINLVAQFLTNQLLQLFSVDDVENQLLDLLDYEILIVVLKIAPSLAYVSGAQTSRNSDRKGTDSTVVSGGF